MSKKKKSVTRRRFLEQVGLAGGSAALYETMTALGLINLPEAWAGPPELPHISIWVRDGSPTTTAERFTIAGN